MNQMSEKGRNLSSAVAIMAVSGYWFIAADAFRPLSRLFPQVLGGIVFVLGLILAILTLIGRGPRIRLSGGDSGERHMRSGTLIGALLLWTALIPLSGLLIASVVGTVVIGLLTFRAHAGTLRAIVIALVAVALFYALFSMVLNVRFPLGLLG